MGLKYTASFDVQLNCKHRTRPLVLQFTDLVKTLLNTHIIRHPDCRQVQVLEKHVKAE